MSSWWLLYRDVAFNSQVGRAPDRQWSKGRIHHRLYRGLLVSILQPLYSLIRFDSLYFHLGCDGSGSRHRLLQSGRLKGVLAIHMG
jgi:hypothetical protein